jgi:hypothetical protein
MIPVWKLRRELHRGYEHLWALAGLVYEPVLKWLHDRWRNRLDLPPDQGITPAGKVAIVLVYQPRGIAPSLVVTLRHLVAQGYAPLIVSNAPLSPASLATLAPVVWRIVERPNFGYDFGGYRDGILLLRRWGTRVERLIVMNDSIWMPLQPGSNLVARMEAATGDVIGGFKHPDTLRKRGGKRRAGFVESYLYLFNEPALNHPAMIRFWQGYRVSSNKLNAVYRGERGFSRRMDAAGLTVTGLFTPAGLLAALREKPVATLRLSLTYAAYTEDDLSSECSDLLQRDPGAAGWREDALRHVEKTIARRRFNASFPYPSIALLGMDFLKKSAGPSGQGGASLHSQMRRQYLRAVKAGDLPEPFPEVLTEITALEPAP